MERRTGRVTKLAAIVMGLLASAVIAPLLLASSAEASPTQILVGQCIFLAPCWQSTTTETPWSFTFNSSQFGLLESGSVPLIATQTSEFTIVLDTTTLNITTSGGALAPVTVGPYEGILNFPGPYPSAPNLAGTFNYTIPAGQTITSASISGDFGNLGIGSASSAGVNVCVGFGPCVPLTATPEPSNVVYLATVLPVVAAMVRRRRQLPA